jgi:hypothetical protein
MGSTRIEQAIDDIDLLGDEAESSCDDIRLAWLASELDVGYSQSSDVDAFWSDR